MESCYFWSHFSAKSWIGSYWLKENLLLSVTFFLLLHMFKSIGLYSKHYKDIVAKVWIMLFFSGECKIFLDELQLPRLGLSFVKVSIVQLCYYSKGRSIILRSKGIILTHREWTFSAKHLRHFTKKSLF